MVPDRLRGRHGHRVLAGSTAGMTFRLRIECESGQTVIRYVDMVEPPFKTMFKPQGDRVRTYYHQSTESDGTAVYRERKSVAKRPRRA
jgi:hypothetical protein